MLRGALDHALYRYTEALNQLPPTIALIEAGHRLVELANTVIPTFPHSLNEIQYTFLVAPPLEDAAEGLEPSPMPDQCQSPIIEQVITLLVDTLHNAQEYPNPYQARYTVDTVSRLTAGIISLVNDDPRLEDAQPALAQLIATGKTVSAAVPRICPECQEPHQDTTALCRFCQSELDENNER